MRKLCILALFFVSLSSCSTYQVARYEVTNVLAVTKSGDTIQVPLSELKRQYNYDTFSNYRFNYGGNWYLWSDWRFRYPTFNYWYYDWYRPYYDDIYVAICVYVFLMTCFWMIVIQQCFHLNSYC